MRLPRTRGAISGFVLVIVGLWAALVPFFGPYLDLSIGTDRTWHWTTGRLWLDVLPGALAVIAGLMLLRAVTRASAGLGAGIAVCAGTWLIVGQSVSFLWNHGVSAAGQPLFGNAHKTVEELVYFYGVGALILFFGAFALGRLALPASAVPVEDAVVAPRRRRWLGRRRRAAADDGVVERPATERPVERPLAEGPVAAPDEPVRRP
ncbi:MAG: hypothetical protein JWN32_744 [Solirubrobacterales bacterium]|nr:hypothetical protein [Solirubrobacterales bacterium]